MPILMIRVPWTMARARRRSALGLGETSVLRLRAWPQDCDAYMHINNGRVLTLMDLGRTDFAVRSGFSGHLKGRGWGVVVGGASVRHRRSINLFQRFTLETSLLGWDGRWWYFEQRLQRADGKLAAHAWVKATVLDRSGATITVESVLEVLGIDDESPSLPDGLRSWQETPVS